MSKKKLIGIIILAASFIMLIINNLAIGGLNAKEKNLYHYNQEVNKQFEKIQDKNSINLKESKKTYKVFDEFIQFINNKQFEEAYMMLDEDYKRIFKIRKARFETLHDFDFTIDYVINKRYDLKDRTILDVIIVNSDEEYSLENKGIRKRTYTVIHKKDKLTITDTGLYSIKTENIKTLNQGIELNITDVAKLNTGIAYALSIKNNTDQNISLKQNIWGIYAIQKGQLEVMYPSNLINAIPNHYTIKPGKEQHFTALFEDIEMVHSIGVTMEDDSRIILYER